MRKETQFKLYESMYKIRRAEEVIADRYKEQEMRCPTHLCIGHEAVASGVCAALKDDDVVFSNHRAHGHYLAKGGSLKGLIAELYGKQDGCSGGLGGSMHLVDLSCGFMGSTPIVAGTVPLAVGAAWNFRLRSRKNISVAFFGDGCFEEGVVHECLNFASLMKLPVIFVCENNLYSVYTHLRERQPKRPIYKIAASHGWTAKSCDGNDVLEVYDAALDAVNNARKGKGPQFLEFSTYRWLEHCGPENDDHLGYREKGELKKWMSKCPLDNFKKGLIKKYEGNKKKLDNIESKINQEVESAFEFSLKSKPPSNEDLLKKVFA